MNKEQLEEKIKNKESVWYAAINYGMINGKNVPPILKELKLDENYFIEFKERLGFETNQYGLFKKGLEYAGYSIRDLFSTKAQAQHYLDNSGIERIEKFPYMTWEEFLEHPYILFKNYSDFYDGQNGIGKLFSLTISDNKLLLKDECEIDLEEWEVSEENFYEAYKLIKKLFLGKE